MQAKAAFQPDVFSSYPAETSVPHHLSTLANHLNLRDEDDEDDEMDDDDDLIDYDLAGSKKGSS
jgi:hypothetical protein